MKNAIQLVQNVLVLILINALNVILAFFINIKVIFVDKIALMDILKIIKLGIVINARNASIAMLMELIALLVRVIHIYI